jgi:hypothetical protein
MRPGRLPDTGNFEKLTRDVIATVLEVDDHIFSCTDYPSERSDNPRIEIKLSWKYGRKWNESNNKSVHQDISKLYYGPIEPPIEGACIGYGSVYCMICDENPEDWCPAQFDPSVFSDNPCIECEAKHLCPCMASPKEREESIELWWKGRIKSVEFEKENWK